MNRSILVVICDFLILSVLSLTSGVGTHKSPIPLYENRSDTTASLEPSDEFSPDATREKETQWAELVDDYDHDRLIDTIEDKEEELIDAQNRIAHQEEKLQEALNESAIHEQQNDQLASQVETAQKKIVALEGELDKYRGEPVIEKYRETVRELNVYMREKDTISDDIFQSTLFLPEVALNGKQYLVAEFESIGLGWKEIKDGDIDLLSFTVAKFDSTPSSQYIDGIYALNQEPRVWLIPSSLQTTQHGLAPIGFDQLLHRGMDNVFLYKKDGRPGRRSRIEVYPDMKNKGYLVIKNVLIDQFSGKYNANLGDVLLTKEGEFVGIVVQEQQGEALCYVLPKAIPDDEMIAISLRKEGSEQFYADFVEKVQHVQDYIMSR